MPASTGVRAVLPGVQNTHSYFRVRHSFSTTMLSREGIEPLNRACLKTNSGALDVGTVLVPERVPAIKVHDDHQPSYLDAGLRAIDDEALKRLKDDVAGLERALRRQRLRPQHDEDRMAVAEYEKDLSARHEALWSRLQTGHYRPNPVRRTYISKADASQSPPRHHGT